jgi:hypothetical protein
MRVLSITFILVACVLIAVGKNRVRRGRREPRGRTWGGWVLVLLGALAMIAGVVLW